MRVARALLAFVALTAAAAAVADGATGRVYPRPGAVTAIGTSAYHIVYAMAVRGGCNEVRVWSSRGTDRRIARHCFAATSTGSGISAVSYSEGRALYLTYTGGNIREWTLWTKGSGSPARRLGFEAVDVDQAGPFVVAQSSEWALAYARGSQIIAFDWRGRRLFSYGAGARVTSLTTQQTGVGAVLETGRAIGLSYDGELVQARDFPAGEPQVAELTAQGLLVKTRRGVEVGVKSYALPANARWHGFASGTFAYGVGNALYIGRISDGRQALVRRFERRYVAQLGRITLAAASGRTLTRERRAEVVSRAFG